MQFFNLSVNVGNDFIFLKCLWSANMPFLSCGNSLLPEEFNVLYIYYRAPFRTCRSDIFKGKHSEEEMNNKFTPCSIIKMQWYFVQGNRR